MYNKECKPLTLRLSWKAENLNLLAEHYGAFCTPPHSGDAAGSFHYALQYKSPVETSNIIYKVWSLNTNFQFIM